MGVKKDIFWRIGVAYLCLLVLGIAIAWKVFYIQQIQGQRYRGMADSITTKYIPVMAERGNIYSNDGHLLATSLPSFEVRMDMKADGLSKAIFYDGIDSLCLSLTKLFPGHSYLEYKKQLVAARKRGDRYLLIKRDITYPQLMALKRFPIFRLGQFKGGLIVLQYNKRAYPYKELANRTIGYMRGATVQPVGLEGSFNKQLNGIPGKRLVQKVSGGQFLPINDQNEIDPLNGKDIITTIDVSLQDVAENALLKTLVNNNADHGCVVVMDVETGAIRAIANLGRDKKGSYIENYNYAVGESHEPGSTFKLASVIALLEDGYATIEDTVDVELGIHKFWNQTMRDAEEHHFRRITLKSAFAHSSNVGISKLVNKHYNKKPEKYLQHLRELGLDKKLQIEIPGEQTPYIKSTSDKRFTRYSLPWMSVGYEIKISPLQMLTLYNAVANNGVMMKPYLVQRIEEYGKEMETFRPSVLNKKICSKKTLSSLHEILRAVVDSGSARNLKNPHYAIAGKTGTAQIADQKHGYRSRVYQSSFVGYFPADKPLYSCIVVVNAPSNGAYYGATVAAPVFKDIADKIYSTDLKQHPPLNIIAANMPSLPQPKRGNRNDLLAVCNTIGIRTQSSGSSEWVKSDIKGKVIQLREQAVAEDTGVVPDVKGMGLKDALYLLERCGYYVNASGAGAVSSQSIPAGTKAPKGQIISIMLSL
ncbi:MAG: transpeptidase family protein [Chitinophagales bacterium]|nr:transpeptidase family protein [Chitinophagales bacterium]